jgi:hypothetical protein
MSPPSCGPETFVHSFSRAFPDSPTSGIKVVVQFGERAGVDPDIGSH